MAQLKSIPLHIKPLCDEIIKNPTIEIIDNLNNELKKVQSSYLQHFRDFILLPLIAQIDDVQVVNKNEVKTHLINCIITLLEKIRIDKVVPLKTVLIVLLKQIYDINTGSVINNLSEEFKLSIVECINTASCRLMTNVLDEFYVDENSKLIAQICHVCVQLIQKDSFRKIKIASINCILSVFQLHSDSNFDDNVLRSQISSIVFIILPKTFTTLLQLTQEDNSKGLNLKALAIKAIRLILTLIFEDYKNQTAPDLTVNDFKKLVLSNSTDIIKKSDEEILGISIKLIKNPTTRIHQLESIRKTKDWMLAATKRLQVSFDLFVKLRANPNRDIRYQYAKFNCDLITKCASNMGPCIPHFLESIITFTEDEDKDISQLCMQTLNALFITSQSYQLWSEIQLLFKAHLIKLPRIICREDEPELTAGLMLLRAHIKFLNGNKLKSILNESETLEKLVNILLTAVELDISNQLILEEHAIRDKEEIIYFDEYNLPWKKFKYLKTAESQNQLREICLLLGNGNASQLVISKLLDMLNINVEVSNEILVLLNFCVSVNVSNLLIENIFEEYLTDVHWNLTIHPNTIFKIKTNDYNSQWYEMKTEGLYENRVEIRYTDVSLKESEEESLLNEQLTISETKIHVLHTCLVVEGTGNLSVFLKDDFHNYLFKSFHKILEKAGNSNYMIYLSGMHALNKIRGSYGVQSISDLIFDSTEYLMYHLKLFLKKNDYNKIGLDILCVILKYSSILLLPYLKIIVNDVLSQDLNSQTNITSILQLLEMCINAINKWIGKDNNFHIKEQLNNKQNDCDEHILKSWINILEQNELPENFNSDEKNFASETVEEYEVISEPKNTPSSKTENPHHITITLTILKSCIKYMSSRNITEKLIVLNTLNEGVQILKDHEDLLPLIHLLWNPLVNRFSEDNLVVINSSLTLLLTLARLSKDFIRTRTLKGIIPCLNTFLLNASKDMADISKESHDITYTQNFKLQLKILKNYGNLVKDLEFEDRDLDSVLETVKRYLNSVQNETLEGNCNDFFLNLIEYDPTTIFIKLYDKSFEKGQINEFKYIIQNYNMEKN